MARYAVAKLDEIDEQADAGSFYQPIRHELGISAFGVTAWTGHSAGDTVVNEHDPGDPTADQELFLVLRGHAAFDIAGDRVDAPTGTLVYAPPGTRRSAMAIEDGTVILLVEGTPGAAYDARGWELWAPLAPRYFAGDHRFVAEQLRNIVSRDPQYPMLWFNLACSESQLGQKTDAIEHLRRAIEGSDEFRASARQDPDLDAIRGESAFRELVGE
jgi:hypothetical protein